MSSLTHYSDGPIVLDRSHIYDQSGRRYGNGKPGGLWVSVDGDMDWPEWCLAEEFRLNSLTWAYRVTLRPHHNLLAVTNGSDLESLHTDYSYEDDFNRHRREKFTEREKFRRNQWPMNWAKLAADYQGLIIAPYLWSHRFDGPFWYYGWDCASGCIWDLSIIDTFELRHIPVLQNATPTPRKKKEDE